MESALKNEKLIRTFIVVKLKSLGIFSVLRFGEISKPSSNKDLAFMTASFLLG